MTARADQWLFAARFDPERRCRLDDAGSLDAIVSRVVAELSGVAFEIRDGSDPGLDKCRRPVFAFQVSPDAFDAFFNSPVGYRAQFLAEPNLGQAANGLMLSRVRKQLVAAAGPTPGLPDDWLDSSLAASSAKIWLVESEFPFANVTSDLAVSAWVQAAAGGELKARWGLHAPVGSRLEVKGAFLDPNGNEVVPSGKIRRRFDIASYGFS